MNRVKLVVSVISVSLIGFVGCTSADIEDLPSPPPTDYSSGTEAQNWCFYFSTGQCFPATSSECPSDGLLILSCPYSSSSGSLDSPSSSSYGTDSDGSSSSGDVDISSSSDILQEYAWCIFVQDQTCLPGPVSVCPPGGTLGDVCPYSSSSSSGVSSYSVGKSSVSSGKCVIGEFEDTRDGNCYKYAIAPNGRIWMSENLNYSKNNTLGWCYVTDGTEKGTEGADGDGCDSPYGRIYNQETAMNVCPPDWNLPSADEWDAIEGVQKMSKDFYVLAGNYDDRNGWKERNTTGFYWTNQNTIFRIMTIKVTPPMGNASATDDYFSVRCIMDATVGNTGNCNGVPFNPLFQICLEGAVCSVVVIGKQIFMNQDLEIDGKSTYDWAMAMNLPSNCNNTSCASQINEPHQGICPEGWHLPNANESEVLSAGNNRYWTTQEMDAYNARTVEAFYNGLNNKSGLNRIRCIKN